MEPLLEKTMSSKVTKAQHFSPSIKFHPKTQSCVIAQNKAVTLEKKKKKKSYIDVGSVRFKDEQIKITVHNVEKIVKRKNRCKIIKYLRFNEA